MLEASAAEVYEPLGFRQLALDSLATAIKLGFPTKDLEDTFGFPGFDVR